MNFRSASLAFALIAITLHAIAETNKFDLILNNGKKTGHASYSISKTKTGYNVHSTFNVQISLGRVNDLPSAEGLGISLFDAGSFADVQYSYDYKLDPDGSFLSGYAQSFRNQTMISMTTDKDRDAITVRHIRTGFEYASQTVALTNPNFLLVPDYDPGSIQVLITTALAHPQTGNRYLVFVPANPDAGQRANSAGFVTLKSEPNAKGTLGAKAIPLKHYSIQFRNGKTDIYTDNSGTLMQVVMGSLRAAYVRSKFALSPDAPSMTIPSSSAHLANATTPNN